MRWEASDPNKIIIIITLSHSNNNYYSLILLSFTYLCMIMNGTIEITII